MTHTCPKCNKEFRYKCYLTYHLERKTPCQVVITPDIVEDRLSCKQSLHKKIPCEDIDETRLELMKLREEIEKLKVQLSEVSKANAITNNVNSANNVNNDAVHNTTINTWDSENYIIVNKELVHEAFEKVEILKFYAMFPTSLVHRKEENMRMTKEFVMYVIKKLHKHPEFRNIMLNKNRSDLCNVLSEDKKWELTPFSEANARIIDDVLVKARKAVIDGWKSNEMKDYNICLTLTHTNPPSCADTIEERDNKIKPLMFAHLLNLMNDAKK